MEQEEASREDLKMFMAFAPAEPQSWFKPDIQPKPTMPRNDELTHAEFELYQADDESNPRVVEFSRRKDEALAAVMDWELEYVKQKYIQWPRAWATEVIRTLPKGRAAPAFR